LSELFESGIKQIRVECKDSVSHYSTKYYHVNYNELLRADELFLTSSEKSIAQVKAIALNATLISYEEICKH